MPSWSNFLRYRSRSVPNLWRLCCVWSLSFRKAVSKGYVPLGPVIGPPFNLGVSPLLEAFISGRSSGRINRACLWPARFVYFSRGVRGVGPPNVSDVVLGAS